MSTGLGLMMIVLEIGFVCCCCPIFRRKRQPRFQPSAVLVPSRQPQSRGLPLAVSDFLLATIAYQFLRPQLHSISQRREKQDLGGMAEAVSPHLKELAAEPAWKSKPEGSRPTSAFRRLRTWMKTAGKHAFFGNYANLKEN